jgi:hypothetical protein
VPQSMGARIELRCKAITVLWHRFIETGKNKGGM